MDLARAQMYSGSSVLGDFPSVRLENSEMNVSWAPMTNAQAEDIDDESTCNSNLSFQPEKFSFVQFSILD